MSYEPQSLQDATVYFSNPDNCIDYLSSRRWPDGKAVCPGCGSESVSYNRDRRTWKCSSHHAKREFSIKVGTIMEDSAIPLDKWLVTMWLVTNCKNGVSSYEIARDVKVTQKSAWFMLHRIRLAMQDKNRGQVRTQIIPDRQKHTLQPVVRQHVEPGAALYTDEMGGYKGLDKEYLHEIIDHAVKYVDGRVHTNGLENFWSLLKRGLSGTYVAVEPFHLFRYLDEQVFRYTNRATQEKRITDSDRFDKVVRQIVGKRLTFAELTGKVGAAKAF